MTAGCKKVNVSYKNLDMFMHLFDSDNPSFAEQTTYLYFRKLFYEKMPEVTLPKATYSSTSDLARILVEYMKQDYNSVSKKILMEAVCILTNFVCVSQQKCHAVVHAGGIETLVQLIHTAEPSSELKIQCIRALGNIAADCDSCSSTDILEMIGKTLENEEFETLKQKEILMRCTMNILRSSTEDIDQEITSLIMKTCYHIVLRYKNNYDILSYAIGCMAYLDITELPYPNSTLTENSQIVDTIIQKFLDDDFKEHEEICVRVLKKIANTESTITLVISHPSLYKLIKKGLKSNNKNIQGDAAWIGYRTAFSEHGEKLFDDDEVYAILFYETCRSDSDSSLKWKCLLVLHYMIHRGGPYRLSWLIARGFCNVYPHLAAMDLTTQVAQALRSLLNVVFERRPHYIGLINKLQVVEKISAEALSEEASVPPLKLQLQSMIESHLSKKKPYTFKLIPRGRQE